ncbi:diguanylate cyclase domain-containing protein [[Limnothrix rosea] IAM M-220]|uniref:diguanylate cyclase domain-containing protein n=1 Tax=[Limnothrix rosea] IAM M-220 TaxID=454133 RepID=UPI001CEDD7BC|nr:diguanylate cyclase [[Limnothrix rosea] IAM M-220]
MSDYKASILIVDDTPNNLRLLSELLTRQNYKVRKAINGSMALQSIVKQPPDLILLDIQMPDMSGYEVCRQLKADGTTTSIPVIFISALNTTKDKVKAFGLGAVDYIPKPFDENEVLARVKCQLELQELRLNLETKNRTLKQAMKDLELALLESRMLRTDLERANQELIVANHKLGELAIVDSLTQIPNRRRFDEYLDKAWEDCLKAKKPLGLILGDIDCFKRYNDYYGHHMGDHCLYAVAQAVKQSVVLARDLPARYGGEEIAVILPNAGIEEARVVANRILKEVQALGIEHRASDVKNIVSISLGVHSLIPSVDKTIGGFITECDQALYISKEQGRDRLTVFSKISAS